MTCKLNGETRLDMGPGERTRICANSVKPGSNVGVALGSAVDGIGVSVGRGVSVGNTFAVNELDVAKMACPVNATTVGRELAGKVAGAESADCEQADKSPRREAMMRILCFMYE